MTSKIKVDNINKVSDDSNIINKCGTTITLGASGDSINLAAGASQSGFGREGSVDWQTGSIKTATFTATSGEGYFCNTNAGSFTLNLPAGSAGAIVSVADYTRTFQNNSLSVAPNGSEKIGGIAAAADLNVEGQSATFVYVDANEGWINVQETQGSITGLEPYICASITGACNTLATSGDYKIATFLNPGSFVVGSAGTAAPCTGSGSNTFDYMVVGGGGAGGSSGGGGGGAGGYRESPGTTNGSYTVSPLAAAPAVALTLTPSTSYPITVGAGGAVTTNPPSQGSKGSQGDSSIFSTITSAGGGGGGGRAPSIGCTTNGGPGGAGGGGSWDIPGTGASSLGGTGNTPPVSPAQGKNGGTGRHNGPTHSTPGGGGGALTEGSSESDGTGPAGYGTGNGGNGTSSSINGTPTARAGGGGGNTGYGGNGGPGGGGNRYVAGTVNTGGGGGGGDNFPGACQAGAGGSGIVIIRYKFQN
jgi:hypothetical protein